MTRDVDSARSTSLEEVWRDCSASVSSQQVTAHSGAANTQRGGRVGGVCVKVSGSLFNVRNEPKHRVTH